MNRPKAIKNSEALTLLGLFYDKGEKMLENKEKKSTYYEAYPKSFLDTNKDGIGDLEGLRSKLTTISQLGANYVLINQIFAKKDDKVDFYEIDKELGDIRDIKAICEKGKYIRIKILLDFDGKELKLSYGDEIKEKILDLIKYWQETGIKGIRIKNLASLYGDDQNEGEDILEAIKNLTDELNLIFIGGIEEINELGKEFVDMAYFSKANDLIKEKNSYKDFYSFLDKAQKLSEEVPIGLDFQNFETPRLIEKILNDDEEVRPLTEALATMLFSLKTIPFVYQGTEIEAKSDYSIDMDDIKDQKIQALYKSFLEEGLDHEKALDKLKKTTNFTAKIPLRWDDSGLGRFSEVKNYYGTMVRYENNYKEYMKHSDSFFFYMYNIIMLRKRESVFGLGDYELLTFDNQVYAYKRTYKDKSYVTLVNLSDDFYEIDEKITDLIKDGEVIKNNNRDYDPEILDSYQAVIIEL